MTILSTKASCFGSPSSSCRFTLGSTIRVARELRERLRVLDPRRRAPHWRWSATAIAPTMTTASRPASAKRKRGTATSVRRRVSFPCMGPGTGGRLDRKVSRGRTPCHGEFPPGPWRDSARSSCGDAQRAGTCVATAGQLSSRECSERAPAGAGRGAARAAGPPARTAPARSCRRPRTRRRAARAAGPRALGERGAHRARREVVGQAASSTTAAGRRPGRGRAAPGSAACAGRAAPGAARAASRRPCCSPPSDHRPRAGEHAVHVAAELDDLRVGPAASERSVWICALAMSGPVMTSVGQPSGSSRIACRTSSRTRKPSWPPPTVASR